MKSAAYSAARMALGTVSEQRRARARYGYRAWRRYYTHVHMRLFEREVTEVTSASRLPVQLWRGAKMASVVAEAAKKVAHCRECAHVRRESKSAIWCGRVGLCVATYGRVPSCPPRRSPRLSPQFARYQQKRRHAGVSATSLLPARRHAHVLGGVCCRGGI